MFSDLLALSNVYVTATHREKWGSKACSAIGAEIWLTVWDQWASLGEGQEAGLWAEQFGQQPCSCGKQYAQQLQGRTMCFQKSEGGPCAWRGWAKRESSVKTQTRKAWWAPETRISILGAIRRHRRVPSLGSKKVLFALYKTLSFCVETKLEQGQRGWGAPRRWLRMREPEPGRSRADGGIGTGANWNCFQDFKT